MIHMRHLIFRSNHWITVNHRFSRNILVSLLQRLYLQWLKCLLDLINRIGVWIKRFKLVWRSNKRINFSNIIMSSMWINCSIKNFFNVTFWVHHVLLSHSSHTIEVPCIPLLKLSFTNQIVELILAELALVLSVWIKLLILV